MIMATIGTISKIEVVGYYPDVVHRCAKLINDGYVIASERSTFEWPYFWRRTYYIELYKHLTTGVGLGIYIDGKLIASTTNYQYTSEHSKDSKSLSDQITEAIEREDYEEAAKLRDLIKQNP
jgi:hypothetical protein